MAVIIISNISDLDHDPEHTLIDFNPWGFSRQNIRSDFQSVLNQTIALEPMEIRLVMEPYLFGNRMRFLETVLRDTFPDQAVSLELK